MSTPTGSAHVAHGYTIADVDRLARVGVNHARTSAGPFDERYQTAWDAIVMTCVEAAEPPSKTTLSIAAARAVERAVNDYQRHHGVAKNGETAPRHAMYWTDLTAPVPSPERSVVEHLALVQIWPCLRDIDRQALGVLAVAGDYQQGADLLGLQYQTFAFRVRRARIRFLALWHEGEEPSRLWRIDRRVRSTSLFGADNPTRSRTIGRGSPVGRRKQVAA